MQKILALTFLLLLFAENLAYPTPTIAATGAPCCTDPRHYDSNRDICTTGLSSYGLTPLKNETCGLALRMRLINQQQYDDCANTLSQLLQEQRPSCNSEEKCDGRKGNTCQPISSVKPLKTEEPGCPTGKFGPPGSDICCGVMPGPGIALCSGAFATIPILSTVCNVINFTQGCTRNERTVCASKAWKYNPQTKRCDQIAESLWQLHYDCGPKNNKDEFTGISTAIGCIVISSDNLPGTLNFLLKFALGISGGVILLMVIATGYTILTSAGNPEKLQAAKENIVSILSGLILIAFSLILLQAIGADILKLPTFSSIP